MRTKQTICLCMIVKDEALVIRRCLDSVRPLIDGWLIVDTGSTDGTQEIIRRHLADLPGELVERPWVDFARNRSEALALARPRADYSLIIDADDEMDVPPGYRLPPLDKDSYTVDITDTTIAYQRTQLIGNRLAWRYRGVLHEFLSCDSAGPAGHLPVIMRRNHDGRRRRDPDTYRNDVAVLQHALIGEADPFLRARYTFYLAQSHRDCGEIEAAVETYLRRADLGHWDQEIFYSLYQAGKLMETLGRGSREILAIYERATDVCPMRAEAAHAASRYCRLANDFAGGYIVAKPAIDLAAPNGGLFIEPWIYDYGLLDEYAVNAYWVGAYESCAGACRAILRTTGVPGGDRDRAAQNLKFALEKLAQADHREPSGLGTAALASSNWQPDRPLGGTELIVEGLRSRLGAELDSISLGINAPAPSLAGIKPSVVWIHHDVDQAAVQWCGDPTLVAGVSVFVFVSYWQRERFLRVFDLPPERCEVIKHATDQDRDFRPWQPAPVVRCAYTSTPFRGLDVLLDAWALLPPDIAELHVWSSMKLYGADDAPYQVVLDRARTTAGVFYHGIVSNKDLRAALRTIDILTYPSTFAETACLSVIEAMAAGCRVIVPSLGALPETTGGYARVYPWCADPRDHATAFAQALSSEIAEPWRGRTDLALAQQTHCATVYSWSRCLEEWRALIERLAGRRLSVSSPAAFARKGVSRGDEGRLTQCLERLQIQGFAPSGILDIGAHDGSFAREARRVFLSAHILMIDALEEKDAVLRNTASALGNATHLIALLGHRAGDTIPFFVVDTEAQPGLVTTGSSMFRENTAFKTNTRAIMQQTLFDVLRECKTRFQFLKLDVQGAELAVLQGLGARLCDVDVILIEMSLVAYNEGAPLLGAVVAELDALGFLLYDLVEDHRYRDGCLLQVDGVFLRATSTIRPEPPFWS